MDLSLRIIINEQGETTDLTLGESTSIGRGPLNRIQIQQNYISLKHALITRTAADGFTIEDCDSRNGTFVNDEAVEGPTEIKEGDILRFGLAACKVVTSDAPDMSDVSDTASEEAATVPVSVAPVKRLVIKGSRSADIYNRTFPLSYSARQSLKKRQSDSKKSYLADRMKQKNRSALKLSDTASA